MLQEAGWLRALARNLVEPSRVDDIVQDTWLAALRTEPDPHRAARPWLSRVLHNVASNLRRGEYRRHRRDATARSTPEVASPPDLAEAAELQRRLATAIERLRKPLRDVVVLAYFHGLDSRQVGLRLGLSPSAVRTRHQRAIEELRQLLDTESARGREAWLGMAVRFLRPCEGAFGRGAAAWLAWSGAAAGLLVVAVAHFAGWLPSGAGRAPALVPTVAPAGSTVAATATPASAVAGRWDSSRRTDAAADVAASSSPEAGIVAPAATAITGRLLVDGSLPAWELRLRLVDAPESAASSQPVSADAVRERRAPRREELLPVTARGAFRFEGMPAGWCGELFVEGCVSLDGSQSVPIASSGADLLVQLRAGPRLFGRLQLSGGGPLAVEGLCELHSGPTDEPASRIMVTRFRAGEDGTFSIPVLAKGDEVCATIRLEVDGCCFLHHETARLDARSSHDLGWLSAEPVRDLQLLVVDRTGRPLAAASVCIDGAGEACRDAATDEHGICTLRYVPLGECSLRVKAPMHAERVLPAPAASSGIVELVPVTGITVRVADSIVAETRQIRLTSQSPLLAATDRNADRGGDRGRTKVVGGPIVVETEGDPPSRWQYLFECPPDGVLHLEMPLPHVPFAAEAIAPTGSVLARSLGITGALSPTEIQLQDGRDPAPKGNKP